MRAILLVLSLALWTAVSHAEPLVLESGPQQVQLIELFTSEGCSSCPPAERWLSGLAADAGLWRDFAPIAWHVDYWDYLGWRDVFSSPRFSARQRDYQRTGRLGTVYTPGVLVAGREWLGWRRDRDLPRIKGEVGDLYLELDGPSASLRFAPGPEAGPGPWEAHLAVLGSGFHTEVGAGENRGRTLPEDFVVLGWLTAPRAADGTRPRWTLTVPGPDLRPGRSAVVAWVSVPGHPEPIQAVGGWLP